MTAKLTGRSDSVFLSQFVGQPSGFSDSQPQKFAVFLSSVLAVLLAKVGRNRCLHFRDLLTNVRCQAMYSWGAAASRCLGYDTRANVEKPLPIKDLEDKFIVKAAAGTQHVAAISGAYQ